ncbi:uncharacterized protein LOC141705105 [Apium graveolens]|uniref:uncharacterized protein LOC141705105 n=1 Tax=Apium graveolens TaxID=4045 RepID=UPI003D7C1179
MKIPAVHTKILDDRSKLVVHFGRESGTKAFRLYDPKTGSIHVSRDVISMNIRNGTGGLHLNLIWVEVHNLHWKMIFLEPELLQEEHSSTSQPSDTTLTSSSSENEDAETSSVSSDSSEQRQHLRLLDDIYEHTTEVELDENELLLMGIDEPIYFEQAVENSAWKAAMDPKNDWEIHHLDIKSAFLNGVIQEEVYVTQPKGYIKEGSEHKVYKLLKHYMVFVKLLEHVIGTSLSHITKFKGEMSREFDMSNMGKLSYYLGLEVTQDTDFIELRQSTYARKVLKKAGMAKYKAVKYPMEYKIQLHADSTGEPVNSTHLRVS